MTLASFNGPFFPGGWGDLSIVDFNEDLKYLSEAPAANLQIAWKQLETGKRHGVEYKLYKASFGTPCVSRIFDALPPESRTAHAQLLVPINKAGKVTQNRAAAIHLAATGDQTYTRRLELGYPLLQQGVSTLILESPYYGERKPAAQRGSKLHQVSDLLILGWATICESISLLHWLQGEGYDHKCMTGLSMGGVHACMTASLYPGDVACAPLLAPRSAAVAYCDGAMYEAMAWKELLQDTSLTAQQLNQVVGSAAQAGSVMRAAKYALRALEELEARQVEKRAASGLSDEAIASDLKAREFTLPPGMQSTRDAVDDVRQTVSSNCAPGSTSGSTSSSTSEGTMPQGFQGRSNGSSSPGSSFVSTSSMPNGSASKSDTPTSIGAPTSGTASNSTNSGVPGLSSVGDAARAVEATVSSLVGKVKQALPQGLPQTLDIGGVTQQLLAVAGNSGRNAGGLLSGGLDELSASVQRLLRNDRGLERVETVSQLKSVLETYTDITRYPMPRRPDATVIVAADSDAYVSLESVQQLHAAWHGSELRMVSGGHVSAFLMQQDAFRLAIGDSLKRLRQPPSPPPADGVV